MTKILPNVWVNILVRFASGKDPVTPSKCSESSLVLFVRFCESFIAPDTLHFGLWDDYAWPIQNRYPRSHASKCGGATLASVHKLGMPRVEVGKHVCGLVIATALFGRPHGIQDGIGANRQNNKLASIMAKPERANIVNIKSLANDD